MKCSRLVYLFGILLLLFIPILNNFTGGSPGEREVSLHDIVSGILPFLVIIEILIYLFFGILSGGGSSLPYLCLYSFLLLLFRLLCCFLSGIVFSDYNETHSLASLIGFWMGNPLLVLLQMFLLMMLGPHLAWLLNPRMVSDKALGFVGERKAFLETRNLRPGSSEATPVGGFVRVYNYEELGSLFLNVMGMEGYILYTHEGLILAKDCQLRFDSDRLAAISLVEWNNHKNAQLKIGFDEPERIISQTSEHNFLHVSFNQRFYGIFIFKRKVDMEETLSRLEPLTRSARELLEMKYSPVI
ncbi:roadblock/LC7 domain-containing protein [Candidatus Sumerlaeota bacterium]|nr:roadblock/LC7 domain-containing protein [Candidatus Sumerlaeota bacterium]